MSRNKRLLILTSSYPSDLTDGRAAAGFFVRDFANEMSAHHQLAVMTQHTGAGAKEIMEERYPVQRFSWSGKGRPLSTLSLPADIFPVMSIMLAGTIASIQYCRREKPDHVIALWAIPCGIWALILKKTCNIPYSIWCLGADIWDYEKSRLTRTLLKQVLKNASHVYADGIELSTSVNDIIPVDCTFLASSRLFKPPQKQTSLKPDGVRHYLFVGRYHHNKGPDILIRAVHLLAPELRSRIHCHLFGGGPMTLEIENLLEELDLGDTITLGAFIGETQLTEILAACDVVVIPSRKDSVSLMLSAALHLNKAIIATDVGDTGYLLKKYKVGKVVSSNSPAAIADCIQKDLANPDDSPEGRKSLKKILDISNAVSRIRQDIELNIE